jgi:ubiquinone/menaquinone biosynthesis C-methylase UbiE
MTSDSQDLVSLCLVAHESPKWVSERIFSEAYRILKPGGVFTMLDLDKDNLEILLENPFVAAIYKQTEPYMAEFLKLDPKVFTWLLYLLDVCCIHSCQHLVLARLIQCRV